MTARTCACGARIFVADLFGWDVWLDQRPARDGMYTVAAGRAAVASDGTHRRHICEHAPGPAEDPSPASPGQIWQLAKVREAVSRRAAERNIAAARKVLDSGVPISPFQQQVALLRVQHPSLSHVQLAALAGVRPGPFQSTLSRVRYVADRLTNQAA